MDKAAPPFLQRYDRYLLLHHPDVWASRIHIVLFYGLALLAVVLLHAFIRPISLDKLPNPDQQFLLAGIPSLLAFGPFAYHLSLYNVEKGFGIRSPGFSFRQQLSLGVSILLLAAIPFLYASIVSERVANKISEQELIQDIQALHLGDVYFPAYIFVFEDYTQADGNYDFDMHKYRLYGDGYLHTKRHYPGQYDLKKYFQQSTPSKAENLRHVRDFIRAFNRYSERKITISAAEAFSLWENKQIPVRHIKPDKEAVDKQLSMLFRAKEKDFTFQQASTLHGFSLLLLALWTLLLIFLKMRIRDFSVGLLAGSALAVFILGGLSWMEDIWHIYPGNILFPLFFSLFIFLFIQISRKSHRKITHSWKSIALMWLSCMVPLSPLIPAIWNENIATETAYKLVYLGFLVLFFLWNVFLDKQFKRLLALPTDN